MFVVQIRFRSVRLNRNLLGLLLLLLGLRLELWWSLSRWLNLTWLLSLRLLKRCRRLLLGLLWVWFGCLWFRCLWFRGLLFGYFLFWWFLFRWFLSLWLLFRWLLLGGSGLDVSCLVGFYLRGWTTCWVYSFF